MFFVLQSVALHEHRGVSIGLKLEGLRFTSPRLRFLDAPAALVAHLAIMPWLFLGESTRGTAVFDR
jgi:hypothetical protein